MCISKAKPNYNVPLVRSLPLSPLFRNRRPSPGHARSRQSPFSTGFVIGNPSAGPSRHQGVQGVCCGGPPRPGGLQPASDNRRVWAGEPFGHTLHLDALGSVRRRWRDAADHMHLLPRRQGALPLVKLAGTYSFVFLIKPPRCKERESSGRRIFPAPPPAWQRLLLPLDNGGIQSHPLIPLSLTGSKPHSIRSITTPLEHVAVRSSCRSQVH